MCRKHTLVTKTNSFCMHFVDRGDYPMSELSHVKPCGPPCGATTRRLQLLDPVPPNRAATSRSSIDVDSASGQLSGYAGGRRAQNSRSYCAVARKLVSVNSPDKKICRQVMTTMVWQQAYLLDRCLCCMQIMIIIITIITGFHAGD
jgi:hypothetical protein